MGHFHTLNLIDGTIAIYDRYADSQSALAVCKNPADASLIVEALNREPESTDRAFQILKADYYADVRGVAEDLIARIKSSEIEDEEDLQTALHEDIDGHQRIIYTFRAKVALLCSDNENHGEEEDLLGDNPTVEARAFWAMRQDVIECLESEDVDLNAPEALREGAEDDEKSE